MGASIFPISEFWNSQYDISILVWKTLNIETENGKKNLTFVPLAPTCVVIRALTPIYVAHLPIGPILWRLLWIFILRVMTFVMLTSFKVMISIALGLAHNFPKYKRHSFRELYVPVTPQARLEINFTNDDYSRVKGPETKGYVRLVGRMSSVEKSGDSSTDSQTICQLKSVVNVMLNIIQEHIPNANLSAVLNNMNIEVTMVAVRKT